MKNIVSTLAICILLVPNLAQAGNMAEPVMEPEIIEQDAASSSGSAILVPLMFVVFAVLATTGGNSAPLVVSDRRLKTDIVPTGASIDGLPVYRYRYIGMSAVYEGVMAQDVLSHRPEAVIHGPGGYMMIDYTKLGTEMRQID